VKTLKKLLFTLLLIFSLPLSSFASASIDELTEDGFRKMKFGEPLDLNKHKLKLIPDKKDKEQQNPYKFYKLEDDILKLNGVKVDSIQYIYYNNRFIGIYIYTDRHKSSKLLETYLKEKLGEYTYRKLDGLDNQKKHAPAEMKLFHQWNEENFTVKTTRYSYMNFAKRNFRFYYTIIFLRKLDTLPPIDAEEYQSILRKD